MLVEVQNVWQRNVSILQEEMSGMFRSVLLDLPVFVEVQKMWQRNVSLLQEEMSGMFRSVLLDLPVPDDVRHLSMQTLHELRPDV
ncbi:hypothetical protein DIPPA_16553 [Diplonema papillatum]|nr:hypothetical protein DIPPA_16553 [Diplonema papillatum]